MVHAAFQSPLPPGGLASSPPAHRLRRVTLTAALSTLLGAAALGVLDSSKPMPFVRSADGESVRNATPAPVREAVLPAASGSEAAMVEPAPVLGADALTPWRNALRESVSSAGPALLAGAADSPTLFARQEAPPPLDAPSVPETPRLAQTVPLPVPRPSEFRFSNGPEAQRRADRQASRRQKATPVPAATEDTRSFFETLFGIERSPTPALAYAALESNPVDLAPRRRLGPVPTPDAGGGTAVYDIGARIVRLPNGETLEAHSGLGEVMDDPSSVHLRMRGATPPGTYDLTEREQPFHGVRALRLTPVGGSAEVYGRVGLLAHTYMLGPNGASNGCVSFRDYERFLQAYLRGEIQRLVVVPGRGQDVVPGIANRGGTPARPARLADAG